jgi:uncharacterized membrane protein
LVLVVCAVTLLGGFFLKQQCSDPESNNYRDLCYNDIQPLYGIREIQSKTFPYIGGGLENGELVDGAIEYPVLTGVFMWVSGLAVDDFRAYLDASAILLAPFGLLAAYLLVRLTGKRALLFAAAPAIVLYAFHNWDLLPVAAVVAGVWFWYRGRDIEAAVLFGVGAALKMYPALFILPLALYRWKAGPRSGPLKLSFVPNKEVAATGVPTAEQSRGSAGLVDDRRGAARVLLWGIGAFVAINLPFALLNFDGWWATYEFHRARLPNYDTVWLIGLNPDGEFGYSPNVLNLLTTVLIVASFIGAVVYGLIRSKGGTYPFLQVSGAALVAFLLWNKVHSPQYVLWLLPFFVLLRVSVWWWVAYSIADLAVYIGVFRWFYEFGFTQDVAAGSLPKSILIGGVWLRALLLVALYVVFLRSKPSADPEHPESFVSQAPPKVPRVGAKQATT